MELIDKDKVVKEIEGLRDNAYPQSDWNRGYVTSCKSILSFIGTLEVKEVDCEREIGIYTTKELLKKRNHSTGVFHLTQTDINSIAKHFFDFGLNVKKEE